MRGRWFRQYESTMDDPKVQMLNDWHYRAWHTLLCFASKSGGEFTGDEGVLSFLLRKPVPKVRDTMQVLLSAKLMEKTGAGYKPHGWDDFQYKSDTSNQRVRDYRERKRNVTAETDVTLHVTPLEAETDSETEQNKIIGPSQAKPDKPKRERKVLSSLPDDCPSETDRSAADRFWRDRSRDDLCARLGDEAQAFRDHHRSRGNRMADWSAAWCTWYGNALKFNRPAANISPFPTAKIHKVVQ